MSLLLDGAEIVRLGDRGDLGHICREVPEGIKQRPNRCQYHAEPTRDVFDRQTKTSVTAIPVTRTIRHSLLFCAVRKTSRPSAPGPVSSSQPSQLLRSIRG